MKHLITLFLLSTSLIAYGQGSTASSTPPAAAFIEVTGTASREVPPDQIFLAIVLRNQTGAKPAYLIQEQEEALRKILLRHGIAPSQLTLADAGAGLVPHRKKDATYEAHKEFLLQLATASQTTTIMQELQAQRIPEVSLVKTDYSKLEGLQKEVRIAALRAAKAKAEYLLQAVGEQLGRPLEIREVTSDFNTNSFRLSNRVLSAAEDEAGGEPAAEAPFTNIKVQFSYAVRYSIK